MYKFLVLFALCILGCAPSVKPEPVKAPVNVIQPAPTPVAEPEPGDEDVRLSPDGKMVLIRGNGWDFKIPVDKGWIFVESNFIFVITNSVTKTMVIFNREDFYGKLPEYVVKHSQDIMSNGAKVVLSKEVTLNGHKSVYQEDHLGSGTVVNEWLFTTGKYGYFFACGGPPSASMSNKVVCDELSSYLVIH